MLDSLEFDDAVRLAEPNDESALVDMVRRMHADSEWGLRDWQGQVFPFNEEKTRASVQAALIKNRNAPDAGGAWIGVVGENGRLQGSAYVCVQEAGLSDGFYLAERWNWVAPEFRRTNAGTALIAFSMHMAERLKLTLVTAQMTRERLAKARFYERKIGAPIGSLFQYNCAAGAA